MLYNKYHFRMKFFTLILFTAISVTNSVQGAALMGGHFDNMNHSTVNNFETNNEDTNSIKLKDLSYSKNDDLETSERVISMENDNSNPLLRGFNLPNHLFNNGKPFYVEKDPLTGVIDFNSKTSANEADFTNNNGELENFQENYNIDRKDTNVESFTKNDVNKISPNFHDYLNLPVKYTSTKYTYPLISSSYANMKIQGNNKNNVYNHKEYKITTYKPPTYISTAIYSSNLYTTTTSKPTSMQNTEESIITSTEKGNSLLSDLFDVFNIENFEDSNENADKTIILNKPESIENNKGHNMKTNYQDLNSTENDFIKNNVIMPTPLYTNFQRNESSSSLNNIDNLNNIHNGFNNSVLNNSQSLVFNIENTGGNLNSDEDLYGDYEYETTASDYDTNDKSDTYSNKNEIVSSSEQYWNAYTDNYFTEKKNNSFGQEYIDKKNKPTRTPTNKQPEYSKQDINNKYDIKYYNQTNNSQHEYNIKDANINNNNNNNSNVQILSNNEYSQYYTDEWSSKILFPNQNKYGNSYENETSVNENNLNKNYINNKKNNNKISNKTDELNKNNKVNSVEYLNKSQVVFQSEYQTEHPSIPIATSLPLGVNHPGKNPIIAFSQNLREQLKNERVTSAYTTHIPLILSTIASTARPEKFTSEFKKPSGTYVNLSGNVNNKGDQNGIIPSKSNIHIAPNQDTVSFVIGNQHAINSGYFVGGVENENQYDNTLLHSQNNVLVSSQDNINNLYNNQDNSPSVSLVPNTALSNVHYASPLIRETVNLSNSNIYPHTNYATQNSETLSLHMKPIIGSEAAVGIGIPPHGLKAIPGQVVDEKLELNQDNIETPDGPLTKIIFPNDEEDRVSMPGQISTFHLQNEQNVIHSDSPNHLSPFNLPDREILTLNSQPMFHQLPSDLTPPEEPGHPNIMGNYPKPPWDPRPGHFFNGRPEYARPSQSLDSLKRLQNRPLPNILPQFRPNAKVSYGHHVDNVGTISHNVYLRQQNHHHHERPIGFFEHLQPPPPPRKIVTEHLRKNSETKIHRHSVEPNKRISNAHLTRYPMKPIENIESKSTTQTIQEHLGFLRSPPKIPQRQIANRRNGDNDVQEVATLQMLQSKHVDSDVDNRLLNPLINGGKTNPVNNSLYVVYPINSSPVQLDVLGTDKQETVVIGTRGEQPLPPSKIHDPIAQHENNDQDILLTFNTRDDKPILKPQTRPNNFPIKSDFPYPLERPEISEINFRERENKNNLESKVINEKHETQSSILKINNQWSTLNEEIQSRIINNNNKNTFQDSVISATLKAVTEKPIAIAYTPTDSSINLNKYNIYDSPYPDIDNKKSEFTVSATMHTHPQLAQIINTKTDYISNKNSESILRNAEKNENISHKPNFDTDVDTTHVPTKLEFQAPFQASLSVDSPLEGWSVIKSEQKYDTLNDTSKIEKDSNEDNKESLGKKNEFDIENFKPQLYGGFKPIFSFPDSDKTTPKDTLDREE